MKHYAIFCLRYIIKNILHIYVIFKWPVIPSMLGSLSGPIARHVTVPGATYTPTSKVSATVNANATLTAVANANATAIVRHMKRYPNPFQMRTHSNDCRVRCHRDAGTALIAVFAVNARRRFARTPARGASLPTGGCRRP